MADTDPQVTEIASIIYEHRWYGTPGQDQGRCNCHWNESIPKSEVMTYAEHTHHVADMIISDTGTGEGER